MELNTAKEMLEAIGKPVEIDIFPLNKKSKTDTSISGNIIAVDPDTRSIGLLQFRYGEPFHVVYIPGTSIKEIHDLNDGPFGAIMKYRRRTPQLLKFIEEKFVKQTENSQNNNGEARREKIIKFFDSSSLQYEIQDDGTIVVGAVKIRPPYMEDSCFSENQLALGRLRKLISQAIAFHEPL
uniref:AD domain-containing protein n=1 Tax=Panagrolaimus sp. PS1159 TaxID=55785 RepID=A0AC35F9J2_9BILA